MQWIAAILIVPPLLLLALLLPYWWSERRLCVVCNGTPVAQVSKAHPVHLCDQHWRQVFQIPAETP